jgi:hypothetical protein
MNMKRIMKLTILLFLAAVFAVADSFSLTYYVQANVDPRTQPYSFDWEAASGTEMAPAIQCLCIITDNRTKASLMGLLDIVAPSVFWVPHVAGALPQGDCWVVTL